MLKGEPLAGSTKARHNFIGDEDNPVFIADCAHTLKVARGRHEDPRGANYRLDQDTSDGVWALKNDHLLEVLKCPLALLLWAG